MRKLLLFLSLAIANASVFAQTTPHAYISPKEAIHLYPEILRHQDFLLFPQSRERPVRWLDSLRPSWIKDNFTTRPYVLHAQPGEYFVFQAGIWAIHHVLRDVRVHLPGLKDAQGEIIPAGKMTCFNQEGIDYLGKAFTKHIQIAGGEVQPLWIGINIPATAKGSYRGTVTVTAGSISRHINIEVDVNGKVLADHGFDKAKRLSRLAWLNETTGINDSVTKGYLPVSVKGNTLRILGRSMKIADNGLPQSITTYFSPSNQSITSGGEPLIDRPFRFVIERTDGSILHLTPGRLQFTSRTPSYVSWQVVNRSAACNVICQGRMEFDGFVDYHLTVQAKKPLGVRDIRMEIAMNKDKAIYMMGLNKPGGLRPPRWDWKWDTSKNQDDVWLGAVNGGLRIKWKADNYVLPLVNVYYTFGRLHLPSSSGNRGRGGVHISGGNGDVLVNAYSGNRSMVAGEEQHYDFELLITPFKTMNKSVQFGARYYQSGNNETSGFIHKADSLGANIITVHQGNDLYPFINYPYSDVNIAALMHFISLAHQDHKRVKVYYTTRELTINLPELWPFLSLNGEIVYPGPGAAARTVTNPQGPDPWLLENLKGRKYIPAWVAHFTKGKYAGMQDLSVITRPDSRLNNFYVAGLAWMADHLHIDGIYIDDCSMDRTTIRRVRKILDKHRNDANIDMHSWNHFNSYGGWASCMNLYMELFPYIDQLWIGEGRNYDTPADYWLVEISGIPFGLPGQMLQDGGNPWRGMVYGMTNRAGWTGTPPDQIWKFWDRYAIKDKKMEGYWDPNNPVSVDNDSVKATVYEGTKESIIAIANFTDRPQNCSLKINFNKLGSDQDKCSFIIPEIVRYQHRQAFPSSGQLQIPAKKGYLIVVEESGK